MNKYHHLFLFVIFLLVACRNSNSNGININTSNQWEIKTIDNKISIINFKIFKDDSIELKTPTEWKIQEQKDTWKYFPYDANNTKLYFAIQKYDSEQIEMNSKEYLIEGFKQVSDKINEFHYVLKRLNFKDGQVCYICTIFTKEKDIDYITYSLISQSGNLIYDFTLKTKESNKTNEVDYRKFLLIVQSFAFDHNKPIGNRIIVKEEKITFEDL